MSEIFNKDLERSRIGRRITDIRKEIGCDIESFSCLAGVSVANLRRIEKGLYSPGFDILQKIAIACGKNIDFV